MGNGVLERIEDGVAHGPRHQQRADGHVATRERLRNRQEIGLQPPVVEREHAARATEPGLHLVDAEERPVAAAQLLRTLEITVGGEVRPVALNGLDDEDRHVLAAERRLERLQIVERDP